MRKLAVAVLVSVLLLGFFGLHWWWSRWPLEAGAQKLDGGYVLSVPAGRPRSWVLLAAPEGQALSESDLVQLSQDSGARILQFPLPRQPSCQTALATLRQAAKSLGRQPDWVAGIGAGGALAWRWLAEQTDDGKSALSVGSKIDAPDCSEPWPQKAEHGHWHLAWNDNPGDATARFVRGQANADTSISDYGTPLTRLLREQLKRRLGGQATQLPTVEVASNKNGSAAAHGDTVTIYYSGDGGWRDLDRTSAEDMAARGYPVVGVDSMRYFWEHKSPERVAADLSGLLQLYREKWGAKRFVLAGYSFGADILPAAYNRLPKADQDQVSALLLLALARSGSFEIEVTGWLGKEGNEAATGPELAKVPAAKLYCIYGAEEKSDSGCTQPQYLGEGLELPGDHHYDGNYRRLAEFMMKAIDARQQLAGP